MTSVGASRVSRHSHGNTWTPGVPGKKPGLRGGCLFGRVSKEGSFHIRTFRRIHHVRWVEYHSLTTDHYASRMLDTGSLQFQSGMRFCQSGMWDEFSLNNDVFFRGPSCSEGNNGGGQKKLYYYIHEMFSEFPVTLDHYYHIQCLAEICEVTEFLLPISIIISNAYYISEAYTVTESLSLKRSPFWTSVTYPLGLAADTSPCSYDLQGVLKRLKSNRWVRSSMSASGAARRPNGERVKTAFFFGICLWEGLFGVIFTWR